VGETPNLAARLQALAEPSGVVIATSTRRLVGKIFDYRDLGALDVKGIAEPVEARALCHGVPWPVQLPAPYEIHGAAHQWPPQRSSGGRSP
jgi:class 3 adenylate cyclase